MEWLEPATYIDRRIGQYRTWYDAKARRCKNAYLALRTVALVAAILLPTSAVVASRTPWPVILAASSVLVCLGLETLLRLRPQWENYRYTEQYLDRERHLFEARAGVYQGLPQAEAFILLVERAEWAIAAENSTTLATMSLSPDAGVRGGR